MLASSEIVSVGVELFACSKTLFAGVETFSTGIETFSAGLEKHSTGSSLFSILLASFYLDECRSRIHDICPRHSPPLGQYAFPPYRRLGSGARRLPG